MAEYDNTALPMRARMAAFIKEMQQVIVRELERVDGKQFRQDVWQRPDGTGGGITCVLQDGNVFEKAGLGVSVVHGALPKTAARAMCQNHKMINPDAESLEYAVAGLSMVLHPRSPMAPTVHLNYRYFETTQPGAEPVWWFGGGADLTPSYLFDEDAVHFHKMYKEACDKHDASYYPKFKTWCDDYFYNKHRKEHRGIGGIFFDDLDSTEIEREKAFALAQDCLRAFIPSYVPILEKRKDMPFTAEQKQWQQIRRGKYVEFNLMYDRGTQFGLNAPEPRVESILMSMPLTASWEYMHEPKAGSEEARMLEVLVHAREWL